MEDLSRAYRLSERIDALDGLRAAFKGHVRRVGLARVGDLEREGTLVSDLLTWRSRLESYVATAFARSEAFAQALKEAFEYFINQRQNKPAELIAKYIDGVMRGGVKGLAQDDIDSALDAVLVLFRYIQVFIVLHGSHVWQGGVCDGQARRRGRGAWEGRRDVE